MKTKYIKNQEPLLVRRIHEKSASIEPDRYFIEVECLKCVNLFAAFCLPFLALK